MDTLNEMYESQWVGHDHMCTHSNNLDMLWSDYSHKLADQVLIPLNTYQAQFAETRVTMQRRFSSLYTECNFYRLNWCSGGVSCSFFNFVKPNSYIFVLGQRCVHRFRSDDDGVGGVKETALNGKRRGGMQIRYVVRGQRPAHLYGYRVLFY